MSGNQECWKLLQWNPVFWVTQTHWRHSTFQSSPRTVTWEVCFKGSIKWNFGPLSLTSTHTSLISVSVFSQKRFHLKKKIGKWDLVWPSIDFSLNLKKKSTAETEITFEELWSKTLNIISISVTLKCEKFQPTKYSVLVYKIYEAN